MGRWVAAAFVLALAGRMPPTRAADPSQDGRVNGQTGRLRLDRWT